MNVRDLSASGCRQKVGSLSISVKMGEDDWWWSGYTVSPSRLVEICILARLSNVVLVGSPMKEHVRRLLLGDVGIMRLLMLSDHNNRM